METKQTAIEWLIQQKKNHKLGLITKEDLIKAKLMEKEQMRIIYDGLLKNVGTYIIQSDLLNFEQYYNKNYGNDL